jgi:expansin (peptidoglycan-binding protein)
MTHFRLPGSLLLLAVLPLWSPTRAGTLALERSPLLGATLPNGATYEVHCNAGGSWVPTGVLIAGNGSSNLVRLDGFPEKAAYRLVRLGTGEIVVPAAHQGLALAASAPGQKEMRFQTASSLANGASWAHDAFAFPDADGWFVRPLLSPTLPQAWFRSVVPARALAPVDVSVYSATLPEGFASFGLVFDDMPQIFRDGYVAAPCEMFYSRGGQNAAAAGECYELAGPVGNVTVMVGDLCPTAPAGTCTLESPFFDLKRPAFEAIFPLSVGSGRANYRLVPAPVTGNVKMAAIASTSSFLSLLFYNHRAGISKAEIRGPASGATGGNWIEMPRERYNQFIFSSLSPAGFPLEVRVTSRFGEVVSFPPIASMEQSSRFVADAQFEVFPELETPPVWVPPPVYTDGLTSGFGVEWSVTTWGGIAVNSSNTPAAYTGNASLLLTNLAAWSGVQFLGPQFRPAPDSFLQFAARSPNGTSVSNLVVIVSGFDGLGAPADSATVSLPIISDAWRVFRIPLQPARAPTWVSYFTLMSQSAAKQPAVLIDAIGFIQR